MQVCLLFVCSFLSAYEPADDYLVTEQPDDYQHTKLLMIGRQTACLHALYLRVQKRTKKGSRSLAVLLLFR